MVTQPLERNLVRTRAAIINPVYPSYLGLRMPVYRYCTSPHSKQIIRSPEYIRAPTDLVLDTPSGATFECPAQAGGLTTAQARLRMIVRETGAPHLVGKADRV